MKTILSLVVLSMSAAAFALPKVSDVVITKNTQGTDFKVKYYLSAPAVVTVDVRVNGVSVGENALTNLTGDANVLCGKGRHLALWPIPADWSAADKDVSAVVTAWATNCPPDYMVVSLKDFAEQTRYYTSTNAFPAPISDMRWRTDYLVMRKIPAAGVSWEMGPWRMGNYPLAEPNLGAQDYRRPVLLTEDYYLAVFETTRRQYAFLNGSADLPGLGSALPEGFRTEVAAVEDLPVGHVAYTHLRGVWDSAADKVWPASGRDNLPSCYISTWRTKTGIKFDLPTEAQWEYACRAGSIGQTYLDCGLTESVARLDEIAWHAGNSSNATYTCALPHRVGLKAPNAWGLYDMLGNQVEWCVNWLQALPSGMPSDLRWSGTLEIDPVGPAAADVGTDGGANRALRGGAFSWCAGAVRSSRTAGTGLSYSNAPNDHNVNGVDVGASAESSKYSGGFRLWAPAQAVR